MRHRILFGAIMAFVLAGCSRHAADSVSGLFPDYSDITVPCNIAPLNFRVADAGRIRVAIKGEAGDYSFTGHGGLARFPKPIDVAAVRPHVAPDRLEYEI